MEEEKKELTPEQGKSATSELSSAPSQSVTGDVKKPTKIFFILGGIILVIILTLIAIFFVNGIKPSTKMPPPEPENKLLATVGERKIYREDAKKVALESYLGSAVTEQVINDSLKIAVERAILSKEAVAKNIIVDAKAGTPEYYLQLKNRVVEGEVTSATGYDLSWWIPPVPYEQKPEFEEQRKQQNGMATEIQARLTAGDDPYLIAKDMIAKYPLFASTLGLNGALVAQIKDVPATTVSRTLLFEKANETKPFFKLFFSTSQGKVAKGIWLDGSGGAVVKIIENTKGASKDYPEWLAEKIKTEVVLSEGITL